MRFSVAVPIPARLRELLLREQRSLPSPLDLRAYLDHLPIICAFPPYHK
jgi:hypothetical protein